jgi:hypothetical protein
MFRFRQGRSRTRGEEDRERRERAVGDFGRHKRESVPVTPDPLQERLLPGSAGAPEVREARVMSRDRESERKRGLAPGEREGRPEEGVVHVYAAAMQHRVEGGLVLPDVVPPAAELPPGGAVRAVQRRLAERFPAAPNRPFPG